MNGIIIFRTLFIALLTTQLILMILYLASAIAAATILEFLIAIDLIFPISILLITIYYQCKFSGIPQARYSESKTKALTTSIVVWSILRIFQCWSGFNTSRQFLGITLMLSGYSYEAYLFIPFILLIQFLVIEIIPFVFVLDLTFLDKVSDMTSQQLIERLYEP